MRVRIPPATLGLLRPLAEAAAKAGLPIFAVGGCVRDWILGVGAVKDLDLVTEGDPTPVARLCARRLGTEAQAFGAFGTLRVEGKSMRVDFAAAREEEYPQPACLPKVRPAPLRQDLFRRDFTINAMALPLTPGAELVDPYGGLSDLRAKVLRTLHAESFRDDPTRVFRAARFLCRFGLKTAPGFVDMARRALSDGTAARLSRHRVAVELLRILAEDDAEAPLRRLRAWGYLELVGRGLRLKVRGASLEQRLGSLVLAQGEGGRSLLRSLPVERGLAGRVEAAWRIARARASPRARLEPGTAAILSACLPGLPKAALQPMFLAGRDLAAAGVEPGPAYSRVLEAAARAQWAGLFSSRAGALRWLSEQLAQ